MLGIFNGLFGLVVGCLQVGLVWSWCFADIVLSHGVVVALICWWWFVGVTSSKLLGKQIDEYSVHMCLNLLILFQCCFWSSSLLGF